MAKKEVVKEDSGKELLMALEILEKEKDISKETMFEAIETSLLTACKQHFGKSDNMRIEIDRQTGHFKVFAQKKVVMKPEDPVAEIAKEEAKKIQPGVRVGDVLDIEVESKDFGRIATTNAKNVILQKIREEERSVVVKTFKDKERSVVTGVVQRYVGKNVCIDLGKADAFLPESEQIPRENLRINDRVKVYVVEVKDNNRGPRISVSRTHPFLVKCLFEAEVAEIRDGSVDIKSIAREPGSRTKMAVWSNNPDVDPVGACVGMNGTRVNAVVDELRGEKIDIICWDDNPGILIENALSPAKVVFVIADSDEKSAKVVVPDDQLSLAIGKEGQNARLAAKLTGFKIDIKSETQAKDTPGFRLEDYYDEEGEYEEGEYYDEEYVEGEYAEGEYAEGEYAGEEYVEESGEEAGEEPEMEPAEGEE